MSGGRCGPLREGELLYRLLRIISDTDAVPSAGDPFVADATPPLREGRLICGRFAL